MCQTDGGAGGRLAEAAHQWGNLRGNLGKISAKDLQPEKACKKSGSKGDFYALEHPTEASPCCAFQISNNKGLVCELSKKKKSNAKWQSSEVAFFEEGSLSAVPTRHVLQEHHISP